MPEGGRRVQCTRIHVYQSLQGKTGRKFEDGNFFFIVSIFYDFFVFNLALGGFYISLLMTDVKKKLLGKPSNPTRFSSNVKGLHQMLKTKTSEK